MKLKRLLYLGYYFQRLDWSTFRRFMDYVIVRNGISRVRQVLSILTDSFRYNISPLEWYQFGFMSLDPTEKSTWAGTGTMYEFQLQANPLSERTILDDKRLFYQSYREFFRHPVWSISELERELGVVEDILTKHDRLVFKGATGKCGANVQVHRSTDLDANNLVEWMKTQGLDLVEVFIEQHPDLQRLAPSAVNTVRIFTLINEEGQYRVLGCRLRISVNSHVDNLAAGNLAAPIDEETGIVSGPGVYCDITRPPEAVHPVTGASIIGFQVPFWEETLEMVKQASLLHPQNRSIGWDVVLTPEGPGLIEGNHDWCKLVWQLPVGQGLKSLLDTPVVDGHVAGSASRDATHQHTK